jgi:hypothetical protein
VTPGPGRWTLHLKKEVNTNMENKHKFRAGVAVGLAGLAAIIGGASIASGETSSTTTPAAPSGYAVPAADTRQPAASPDNDHDGRPCPKDGQGSGSSSSEQSAPAAPAAPSTTTSDL